MKRILSAGLALMTALALRTGAFGAEAPTVTLSGSHNDAFHVEGRFKVEASSQAAWRTLSDYGRIGDFISSIDSSRVKENRPDGLLVEQVSHNGVWRLRRRFEVLLKIKEFPGQRIEFEDVGGKSFNAYRGSWQILAQGKETQVTYILDAEIKSSIPLFVSSRVVRKNIEQLLKEVMEEMRRSARQDGSGPAKEIAR